MTHYPPIFRAYTKEVGNKKLAENEDGAENIIWRISSTLFSHLRYDVDLTPIPEMSQLHNKELIAQGFYKTQTAHDKLLEELRAINLAPKMTIEQPEDVQQTTV